MHPHGVGDWTEKGGKRTLSVSRWPEISDLWDSSDKSSRWKVMPLRFLSMRVAQTDGKYLKLCAFHGLQVLYEQGHQNWDFHHHPTIIKKAKKDLSFLQRPRRAHLPSSQSLCRGNTQTTKPFSKYKVQLTTSSVCSSSLSCQEFDGKIDTTLVSVQ